MGDHQIELSMGAIEYKEVGAGPPVVLLHGLLMDESLWDSVIEHLQPDHRCIVPTLPLGAHRLNVATDADLSMLSIARLVTELIGRLDLRDVTLVGNDTGGALVQIMIGENTDRIGRVVLVSCDAFENFPPGLTGKTLVLSGKLPPVLFGAFMQQLRLRPVRRLPIAFGWLTKRGDRTTKRWLRQIWRYPAIRRDTVRVLRAIDSDRDLLVEAAEELARFDRPALIVWASKDRVMPLEHGRRLAELLPDARMVEVDDSYALIPLDQPARLAQEIRDFIHQRSLAV